MKKICAVLALLLLLFTCTASADVRVIDKQGKDITKENFEVSENETPATTENSEDKKKEGIEGGAVKAAQTAFENALNGFVNGIIDQMMEGSVTIFESNAETDKNGESKTVSYSIKSKPIDPYAPSFVRQTQLYTGGFYLLGVFFTILASYLMRLIYEKFKVQFSEFRMAFFGEEKPYTNDTTVTVAVIAMVLWVVYFIYVHLITWFRNLVVYSTSPTGVQIPNVYADSIPTALLTAIASYSSALESATGEYGVYTFNALIFIAGIISLFFLIMNAPGSFWKFNITYWGLFTLFNFVEIFNAFALSAGVEIYLHEGNPIYVTIGLLVSCLGVILLAIMITVYAIRKGKKFIPGV